MTRCSMSWHPRTTEAAWTVQLLQDVTPKRCVVDTGDNRPVHQETGLCRRQSKLTAGPLMLLVARRNNMCITRDLQQDLQQDTQVHVSNRLHEGSVSPTSKSGSCGHWATQLRIGKQSYRHLVLFKDESIWLHLTIKPFGKEFHEANLSI